MKALVLFSEEDFTKQVASRFAAGLGRHVAVESVPFSQAACLNLSAYDLVAMGSGVSFFRLPPETKKFLDILKGFSLFGRPGVVFSTYANFGKTKTLRVLKQGFEETGGRVVLSFSVQDNESFPRKIFGLKNEAFLREAEKIGVRMGLELLRANKVRVPAFTMDSGTKSFMDFLTLEIERLFSGLLNPRGYSPKTGMGPGPGFVKNAKKEEDVFVDVIDKPAEVVVLATVPTVNEEDVKISYSENRVELKVSSKGGVYKKTIKLPMDCRDSYKKSFRNGVLELTFEKN